MEYSKEELEELIERTSWRIQDEQESLEYYENKLKELRETH